MLILSSAVATAAVAGVLFASASARRQSHQEAVLQTKLAVDGAVSLAKGDLASGKLALDGTKSYVVAGITVAVTASTGDTAGTIALHAVATNGSGRVLTSDSVRLVASPNLSLSTLWEFAVASNSGFSWPLNTVVTGSVYFRNSISILSGVGSKVTKDFKTSSSFNPLGILSIGGSLVTGIKPYSWPTLNASDYTSRAAATLTGPVTLNGYTFPSTGAIVVVNGNLTLHGTIVGKGAFFVTGSVTIDKNVTHGPGDDHFLVVTPNNVTISAPGNVVLTVDAYIFAGGQIATSDKVSGTGALVANSWSAGNSITMAWDQWILKDPANSETLKAPGLWP